MTKKLAPCQPSGFSAISTMMGYNKGGMAHSLTPWTTPHLFVIQTQQIPQNHWMMITNSEQLDLNTSHAYPQTMTHCPRCPVRFYKIFLHFHGVINHATEIHVFLFIFHGHWKRSGLDANFVVIGGTGGCHNDWWWQSWHHVNPEETRHYLATNDNRLCMWCTVFIKWYQWTKPGCILTAPY